MGEWREKDGVIYFSVTSDGTTGEGWVSRLAEIRGLNVGEHVNDVLRSNDFCATRGVRSEIAVMKGELFINDDRLTSNIRVEAKRRKFQTPNAELACLISEDVSEKQMEAMGLLWIATMHEPIEDSSARLNLLGVVHASSGRWISTFSGRSHRRWRRRDGFAFVVSQTQT